MSGKNKRGNSKKRGKAARKKTTPTGKPPKQKASTPATASTTNEPAVKKQKTSAGPCKPNSKLINAIVGLKGPEKTFVLQTAKALVDDKNRKDTIRAEIEKAKETYAKKKAVLKAKDAKEITEKEESELKKLAKRKNRKLVTTARVNALARMFGDPKDQPEPRAQSTYNEFVKEKYAEMKKNDIKASMTDIANLWKEYKANKAKEVEEEEEEEE